MLANEISKIGNETIQRIKEEQKIEFDKEIGNWIPAGSGNFEKTHDNGRYRDNCNTYRDAITCEDHKTESLKLRFYHCNKLDCETCFIHASSERARNINDKLLEFKKEAMKHGIKTGNIIHLILSPRHKKIIPFLRNYNRVRRLRRIVFKMLKESGMFAGVLFTQIHSIKCLICGEPKEDCKCEHQQLYRTTNIHFHVLGYGYLIDYREFREKYPDWIYINTDRRKDAYHTLFYILTNVSLWRKRDGRLYPAYQFFGWLKSNKFVPIEYKIKATKDQCPICKKPRKIIIKGVSQRDDTKKIEVLETEIELGREAYYRRIVCEYKIEEIESLRKITIENKMNYRKYKREKEKEQLKEGNGYG